MKRERLPLLSYRLLWPAVALVVGLALVAVTIVAAKTLPATPGSGPGGIQGILYEPDGVTPVDGGWIEIYDENEQPWMGAGTASDGSFAIPNLPPGTYTLHAYPPDASPYAASLPKEVDVLSGLWSTTALTLTQVRISGWVRDSGTGARIADATVVAHDDAWTFEQWDTTNITGEFKIGGVQIGVTYTLEVLPPDGSDYVPLPDHYTAVPTATNVVLELQIPPTNVVGVVHDPNGMAVENAGVVLFRDDYWKETSTDISGTFLFRGVPTGTFWLHAGPPWGVSGLVGSEPISLVITSPTSLVDVGVITLPHAYKTVTGQVLDADTGGVITDALVSAHRLDGPGYADTPTDQSGTFTLSLTGGEWNVKAEPLNPPAQWIFLGPPAWVVFDHNTVTQTEVVTLEVVATNAWVIGQIVCPNGNLCPGDPPPDAFWVELRGDEIGNGVELKPNYTFAVPIPDGWYELVVHVEHPMLQGPEPIPVFVGPGQVLDVGDIQLLEKDARITGRVFNELGIGVPGVPVVGWRPDGFGWGWAETDAQGVYTMPVIGGEWFVEPEPTPEQPYVFRLPPRLVRVAPGGTMQGVDFPLTNADARVEGIAVDANSGERIWGLDGWAWAERYVGPPEEFQFFSDAPLEDGGFTLKVGGGYTYAVGLDLPPHAPYVSGGTDPFYVSPGSLMTVAVPLEPKDALIEGFLVDASTGQPPTEPIWAEVFGEDEAGHWVVAGVDPATAFYDLGVISGTWSLRPWVDPDSGYVASPTATLVTVESGQVVTQHFAVWPINAVISGTVKDPDGNPVQAFVFAEGESPFVGHFETQAQSDGNGYFELVVPEGGYVVGAALPGDELAARGWLNPPPVDVPWVSATSPVTGLNLQFRRLDAVITGTITFAPGLLVTPTHPAYVWGWAETGEWAETEAITASANAFTYALPVVSGTVWHVGAVYEDWDNGLFYESAEEVVDLTTTDVAVQNLELGSPQLLPQPIIVSFDGTTMQTIVLPDGTELKIPPGALVVSGTVTLYIFPTQELLPGEEQEVVGMGYEIWATDQNGQEITKFNKNVVITFQYPPDAVLAQQGISEYQLVPVYFSTLMGRWVLADSYVVDTLNNEITLQISHFTKFGVASVGAKQFQVYLPIVLK